MSIELPQGITAETVHGLPAFRIDTPAATGLVFAQGAHVAQWAAADETEVLWLSQESLFQPGKAIRGGIPVCWPWFGPGRTGDRTPAHGFARTSTWRLVAADVAPDGTATLALELTPQDVADLAGFTQEFTLRLTVSMGKSLRVELNTRAGSEMLDIEEALHTYFDVRDAEQVRVEGLAGAEYLDKLTSERQVQQGAVEFTAETDRVYSSDAQTRIVDEQAGRSIVVDKDGSAATVVWNPWVAKSAAMADFGDEEWHGMCCVETANCLASAVQVPAGQEHTMALELHVAH